LKLELAASEVEEARRRRWLCRVEMAGRPFAADDVEKDPGDSA
jgi:hypothetical protein